MICVYVCVCVCVSAASAFRRGSQFQGLEIESKRLTVYPLFFFFFL